MAQQAGHDVGQRAGFAGQARRSNGAPAEICRSAQWGRAPTWLRRRRDSSSLGCPAARVWGVREFRPAGCWPRLGLSPALALALHRGESPGKPGFKHTPAAPKPDEPSVACGKGGYCATANAVEGLGTPARHRFHRFDSKSTRTRYERTATRRATHMRRERGLGSQSAGVHASSRLLRLARSPPASSASAASSSPAAAAPLRRSRRSNLDALLARSLRVLKSCLSMCTRP